MTPYLLGGHKRIHSHLHHHRPVYIKEQPKERERTPHPTFAHSHSPLLHTHRGKESGESCQT